MLDRYSLSSVIFRMFTPYRDNICMVAREGSLLAHSTKSNNYMTETCLMLMYCIQYNCVYWLGTVKTHTKMVNNNTNFVQFIDLT